MILVSIHWLEKSGRFILTKQSTPDLVEIPLIKTLSVTGSSQLQVVLWEFLSLPEGPLQIL